MALSTSELVADNPSASSVGGTSGTRLAFASALGPGFGAWLVEARPSASKTSPAKFGCNQEIEHAWTDPYLGYWDFDLRYLGHQD